MERIARTALAALMLVSVPAARAASGECPRFPPEAREAAGGAMASTVMGRSERHAPPAVHVPIPDGSLESVTVTFERSGCFGDCPGYKVELRGDGTGTYRGDGYVTVDGEHRFSVDPALVACLLDDFRAVDFWSLDASYEADVTDLPEQTITLTIGGKTKSLYDYAGQAVGMPPLVSALEDAIDDAAHVDRWVRGNDETIPALEAEGFRFGSRAGGLVLGGAIERGTDELALALIARRVPVGVGVDYGWGGTRTPVETAAFRGKLELVRALIAAGAFRDHPGAPEAALRAAAAMGYDTIVAEVLRYRPEVDAPDSEGYSALMKAAGSTNTGPADDEEAATRRQIAIIRMLARAGADPNLRNREGESALFETWDLEVMRALISVGANIELRNREGDTPLLATDSEDLAIDMISVGADPLAKTRSGKTFLAAARAKGWTKALAAAAARAKSR